LNTGSVVLCIGPERWLRARAVAELKKTCVAAGFEETDFVRLSGPGAEPRAILDAVGTAPFGSPRRLVVVDDLEELTLGSSPWLEEILAAPNLRNCVAVCADRCGDLPRGAQVRVVACQPLKAGAVEDWVSQNCLKKGKRIEPAAAAELVRRMGSGLQGLDLALDSLVLMMGDSPAVRPADVELLVPPSLQQTAFEILDAASSGGTGRAVRALREAMALGRIGMDQFMGAMGWYLRHRLRGWPASRFQRMLEELIRTDARMKQGHPSPEWLADRLLLKLR